MAALVLNPIRGSWGRGEVFVIHHIFSVKPLKNLLKNTRTHARTHTCTHTHTHTLKEEVAAPAKMPWKLTMKYKSALFYAYI